MNDLKIKSIIEGILFAWGDPVDINDLRKVLEIPKEKANSLLSEMEEEYNKEKSGLRIVRVNDNFQLSTKPENYDYISSFVSDRNKKNLSNAALETLAIIAYKQPVTKIEIEEIRGVKCDGTIRALTEFNLVEIIGKLDKIGKPNIYGTTEDFLKKFGLSSLSELPALEEDEQIKMTFLEEI